MEQLSEIEKCSTGGCPNRAQMAIRMDRVRRIRLKAVVDFDNRTAPRQSVRYCAKHGREMVGGMIATLLGPDAEMPRPQVPVEQAVAEGRIQGKRVEAPVIIDDPIRMCPCGAAPGHCSPISIGEISRPWIMHEFEAGEGSSGLVCTRMVELPDGSGDACGAPADQHLRGLTLCPTCHAAKRSTNFGQCPDQWHSLRWPEVARD